MFMRETFATSYLPEAWGVRNGAPRTLVCEFLPALCFWRKNRLYCKSADKHAVNLNGLSCCQLSVRGRSGVEVAVKVIIQPWFSSLLFVGGILFM